MENIRGTRRNYTREAFDVRENFINYYNSAAGVSWQLNYVSRGRLQTDNE